MRKPFIAANWKMHGTQSRVSALLSELIPAFKQSINADIVIFPSFVYLQLASNHLKNSVIQLGAQNLNEHSEGAYTGEVSGEMLRDMGCQYVLVGHSERRHQFNETNELVALKFEAALQAKLIPVLCVGEAKEERKKGITENVISAQITAVIDQVGIDSFKSAIIAYEPVWAIGTGVTATPRQAQSVHRFIRLLIASHHSSLAQSIRIVYGGSINAANSAELFKMPDVDGGLVGGASLKADEFIKIVNNIRG